MSNREALRKLIRRIPPPPDVKEAIRNLAKDAPIAAAVVGGSIIEVALERLITTKLRRKAPDLQGQLFQNRGPLSDFHSKILIAHAFGITPPHMVEDLHSIKAIRNAFAHAKVPITFDTPEVAKEIASLIAVDAVKSIESAFGPLKFDNQGWFGFVVLIYHGILDGLREHSFDELKRLLLDGGSKHGTKDG
jgi:hypothetical protein